MTCCYTVIQVACSESPLSRKKILDFRHPGEPDLTVPAGDSPFSANHSYFSGPSFTRTFLIREFQRLILVTRIGVNFIGHS